MKTLITRLLFLGLAGTHATAWGADTDGFVSFQPKRIELANGTGTQELKTYTFNPEDLIGHVTYIQAGEKKYELSNVQILRVSSICEKSYEVNVTLFDSEQTGLMTPYKLSLDTYRQSLSEELSYDVCAGVGGCRETLLKLKEWYREATEDERKLGHGSYYYRHALQIKSIEYNDSTGEWRNLVLVETLYQEITPPNQPHGGITVGN